MAQTGPGAIATLCTSTIQHVYIYLVKAMNIASYNMYILQQSCTRTQQSDMQQSDTQQGGFERRQNDD